MSEPQISTIRTEVRGGKKKTTEHTPLPPPQTNPKCLLFHTCFLTNQSIFKSWFQSSRESRCFPSSRNSFIEMVASRSYMNNTSQSGFDLLIKKIICGFDDFRNIPVLPKHNPSKSPVHCYRASVTSCLQHWLYSDLTLLVFYWSLVYIHIILQTPFYEKVCLAYANMISYLKIKFEDCKHGIHKAS